METIKIEDLKNKKNIKECFDSGVEVKHTVSIVLQKSMAETIADMLLEEDKDGILTYDPIEYRVLTAVATASLYTNIELSDNDYDNYDILNACGLVEYLVDYANDESDCTSFDDMLIDILNHKMEVNDVSHIVAKSARQMVNIFDNTVEHLNSMLDKGDPNKIAKYMSKGIEMIASKMPDFSNLDLTKDIKEQIDSQKLN